MASLFLEPAASDFDKLPMGTTFSTLFHLLLCCPLKCTWTSHIKTLMCPQSRQRLFHVLLVAVAVCVCTLQYTFITLKTYTYTLGLEAFAALLQTSLSASNVLSRSHWPYQFPFLRPTPLPLLHTRCGVWVFFFFPHFISFLALFYVRCSDNY